MNYVLDFSFLAEVWPMLLAACWQTVKITALSLSIGFILGTLSSLARLYGPAWLKLLASIYVETIRNTPLIVQLFIVYFGISSLNVRISAEMAAIIAVSINTGAYTSEIMRAGIESISRTQWEAAECLGMTKLQTTLRIILPQAIKIAAAPTVGFMVQAIKNTSLVSVIGFVELTRAGQIINNTTFEPFAVFMAVAALYFAICFPLSKLSQSLERRFMSETMGGRA